MRSAGLTGRGLALLAPAACAVGACAGGEVLAPVGGAGGGGAVTSSGAVGAGALDGPSGRPRDGIDVAWAHRWGGRNTDERVAAVVAEPGGGVVVAGTLGAFDRVEPHLRATDEEDVLLARFDAEGAVTGTLRMGSFGHDAPRFLSRRDDGSLVVTGTFSTVIDEVAPPLVAYGGITPFVIAVGEDLAPRWGVALYGADVGRGELASAIDAAGDVVVAGTFSDVLMIEGVVVTNAGEHDAYVARFDPGGALRSLVTLDGDAASRLEIGAAAAVERDVVVAVQLEGVLAAGGTRIAEILGAPRPVLVRVDPSGAVVAATAIRGTGPAAVGRLVRREGGLLASLALGGTVDLQTGSVEAAGEGDVTLLWTDDVGAPVAARTWGDRRAQGVSALDLGPGGAIAAAGSFQGALDFGVGSHKAPAGRPNAYVVELDRDGAPLRSFTAGDPPLEEGRRPGSQSASGVAWVEGGGVVAAGSFTGELQIGDRVLEARGDLDGWIARIAPR